MTSLSFKNLLIRCLYFHLLYLLSNHITMNSCLIIIDIQNDYFHNGSMELVGSEEASVNAKAIIDRFREEKLPIVFIQHIAHYSGATFFIPNTYGVKIHNNVKPVGNEKVITKHYPNSFRETELLSHLNDNNISDLIICGMMTHMCIDTTVRAAYDLRFNNTLIGDACATKNLDFDSKVVQSQEVQTSFLAALHGTFANVINSNEFLNVRT